MLTEVFGKRALQQVSAGLTYQSATLDNYDEIAKREAANFIAAVSP